MRFGDPATVLVAEARTLLGAAERREPVPMARARAFARACLEMTEIGRTAMAVMDGGVFAGLRLVELAENLRVEFDVNDRERKSIDEPTTDVELTLNAAHERPFVGGFADRRLGCHDVFVESMRGNRASARIPAHSVEKLGSRV